ncbi:PspA/IM30 family protein [Desulfogranum mediterraneum]|uniref:PspA/IM30 family protein n=1 Tax=Desulfogranum mediterraneum TaxID=160661 RepID=UPI0003FB22CF|nr:PspA/IM30 family protein [Desulfogranum mediterraneum]
MKEGLIARTGRILSGTLHSLIDTFESAVPESVMTEALREIDAAIDEVRAELGSLLAANHLAGKRLLEAKRQHQELSQKISVALKESREDLAETAVARQLDLEAQIPVLETTISDNSSQEKELERFITALQAKRREMEEDIRQYRQSLNSSAAPANSSPAATEQRSRSLEGTVERASSAFDRVFEQATGIGAASAGPTDHHSRAKLAELDELARKHRIQERLAALKTDMGEQ